jgi:replicative DNA helicase
MDESIRGAASGTERLVDGEAFISNLETTPPSLWGTDGNIAWSSGEPMLMVGPQGVGKTSLAQQVMLARIGVLPATLIGLDVTLCERVLYVAADRPRQAARSLRRMVTDEQLPALRERLVVHRGPLDFDIGRHPEQLYEFVAPHGVQAVVLDSIKDLASKLTDDEVGSNVNAAFQRLVAHEIDVLGLHHQRKGQQGAKPRTLEDVYGSTWITAGCGSVILLWGKPGDPIVELEHLKQPAEPVGPLKIIHDHAAGRTRIFHQTDLAELAGMNGGLTIREAAKLLFDSADPSANEIEKARRQLKSLADRGVLVEHSPGAPQPAVYRPTRRDSRSIHDDSRGDAIHAPLLLRSNGGAVSTHAPDSLLTQPVLDPDDVRQAE